jgi:hypothetical protein
MAVRGSQQCQQLLRVRQKFLAAISRPLDLRPQRGHRKFLLASAGPVEVHSGPTMADICSWQPLEYRKFMVPAMGRRNLTIQ